MKTVLLSRFSALGDVAIAIPVVYEVCRANPAVRFIFITRPAPAKLFINAPANLTVVPVDLKRYPGVTGMRTLARELRKTYGIDTYADLHDVLRTKLLRLFLRMAGVRCVRLHKDRTGRRRLTRERGKVMAPLTPSADKYRTVLASLGLRGGEPFTGLFAAPPDPALFAKIIGPRAEGQTWVAIAPFAQHKGKIYPLELMERVVAELAGRPGYRLLMMGGGEAECATFEAWRERYGHRVVNVAAARLGFAGELALLAHCDVMLSMDSANMHLASLVGLRVVSVWGATHPYCGFMGYGQSAEDAIQRDLPCRPCSIYGNKPCRHPDGDYPCLRRITPESILARLDG